MSKCPPHRIGTFLVVLAFLAAGCGQPDTPPTSDADDSPVMIGSRFDPTQTGTVVGRVTWEGDLPDVPPITVWGTLLDDSLDRRRHHRDNPHRPHIDPSTRGVANVVIWLHGVDPERSRPWDHAPVRVELRDYEVHVIQGDADAPVGFVRQNDPVTMVSRQEVPHALRVSGAAAFTLPFPDPDQPLSRRFAAAGVVELGSGLGYYWMRGYLFVGDHPYHTRTDQTGRFTLPQVPAGSYELECWAPNWNRAGIERDPESSRITRQTFHPPVRKRVGLTVEPGATASLTIPLRPDDFAPPPSPPQS